MALQQFLQGVIAVCGLCYVIRIYLDAKQQHPPCHYHEHSTDNIDIWRWRKPDEMLALKVLEDKNSSRIKLPVGYLLRDKIMVLLGYGFALASIVIYIALVLRGAGVSEYLMASIFVLLATMLLHVGSRVTDIVLSPTELRITRRYAFFLHKTQRFLAKQSLQFSGKTLSLLELTTDHKQPDFKLYVKTSWFYSQCFILAVNQSQGSWLVEGLIEWYQETQKIAQEKMPQIR